jgi:F0F1-type ATP synthase membrane subunit b/b'
MSLMLSTVTEMFILNDAAKNDSVIQLALANYTQRLNQEEQQRQAIRAGLIQSQRTQVWNISDRD